MLLEYGWRKGIPLELAKQLLLLLTFVAGGVPGQNSPQAPEELMLEAFGALAALFRDLSNSIGGPALLVETGTVPALGHCVAVLLDGITDGPSSEVQLRALRALDAVWACVRDLQALSTFLPGTISGLTKCLTPSTTTRRSRKTIVLALEVLEHVLLSILSDVRTRNIKDVEDTSSEVSSDAMKQMPLTKSWLKATTAQIKLALSQVIKLRRHESTAVLQALNQCCLVILDECHDTLTESTSLLVETCMTLAGIDAEDRSTKTTLTDLAMIHSDLAEFIKSTVYNWVTSLPRVMQSNDQKSKILALNQLSKSQALLAALNLDSSILEDALATSLRDSVTVTLDSSNTTKLLTETDFDFNSQAAMTLAADNVLSSTFQPIILSEESQSETRSELVKLLASFGTRQSQLHMASQLLEYSREAIGPSLISAFWLSSQLVKVAASENEDLDEFFNSSLTLSNEQDAVNQEIFSYSLSMLIDPDERTSDWRLQAIALEVVATTAQHLKKDFRPELVDALYPIAQLLGSPNTKLREHAITCLNVLSRACGYANASDMIIENVDYMVNAISLRLNTFDISPQAPQVLVMMIRLTGPSLLPFLDDVVSSIFAALDNFHGYQRLVDILFSVLGEIVAVGSKSGQLQIEGSITIDHRKGGPKIPTIDDIIEIIKKKKSTQDDLVPSKDVPQKPWKDAKTLLHEADESDAKDYNDGQESGEIQKANPTKVYLMVQSIARLSQYYLTSQSPILRTKLLKLIGTACKALHNNEDEFLPLVNDIWPVVVKRLYDEESFVKISAADAVADICRCAGDFMATRMQAEWSELIQLARHALAQKLAESKGVGSRGIFSQTTQVWEGLVRVMIAIVEYVRIDDEMFDEVVELFADLLPARADVRDALSRVNGDAVWLALQLRGKNKRIDIPLLAGYGFAALDDLVAT